MEGTHRAIASRILGLVDILGTVNNDRSHTYRTYSAGSSSVNYERELKPMRYFIVWCAGLLTTVLGSVSAAGELHDPQPEPSRITSRSNPAIEGYSDFAAVSQRIQALEKSPWATVSSIGKTAQGRDLWLVTLGAENRQPVHPQANSLGTASAVAYNDPPAILVVGNVHAAHLVGCEIALGMAEQLVAKADAGDEKIVAMLNSQVIYFIPSPTPDATERNFTSTVSRELTGNGRATDDDRDFAFGEDGPQDLNGDGLITLMRIHDDLGTHRTHPDDPRLMVAIDRSKNERGQFRVMVEAKDVDGDGKFGEDAGDGVDFNRNHTFRYSYFGKSAGIHQVSEAETRAVVDFAFDHPNINLVLTLSPEDNLFNVWRPNAQTERERIKTALLSADATQVNFLAEKFRKLHGGKDAPASPAGEGSFSEWAYFHYGRWSFASRGWWIPKIEKPKKEDATTPTEEKKESDKDKTTETADLENPPRGPRWQTVAWQDPQGRRGGAGTGGAGTGGAGAGGAGAGGAGAAGPGAAGGGGAPAGGGRRGGAPRGGGNAAAGGSPAAAPNADAAVVGDAAADLNALQWFAAEGIDGFVDWKAIEHPDFPGQVVEVGGFKPFCRLNPPAKLIPSLIEPHIQWLQEAAAMMPKVEVRDIKTEKLGAGLVRITCRVVNVGFLPTIPEIGNVTREGYPLQVKLEMPQETQFIDCNPRNAISRLDGINGSAEQTWLVRLPENVIGSGTISVYGPAISSVNSTVEVK